MSGTFVPQCASAHFVARGALHRHQSLEPHPDSNDILSMRSTCTRSSSAFASMSSTTLHDTPILLLFRLAIVSCQPRSCTWRTPASGCLAFFRTIVIPSHSQPQRGHFPHALTGQRFTLQRHRSTGSAASSELWMRSDESRRSLSI